MSAFALIQAQLSGQGDQPPVHLWHPDFSGDIDIVIRANGDWYHEGSLIERHKLVQLFASILRREADGDYYLVTPAEKWRLQVEDAPLVIIDMDVNEAATLQQVIIFTSNMQRFYTLGDNYPLQVNYREHSQQPSPYLLLDNGLSARLTRSVFYRLVDIAEAQADTLSVRSQGSSFELGKIEE